MKFNICVAIQIKSSNLKQHKTLIENVLIENPEFIELRFDYIDDLNNLTSEFVEKLRKSIQPKAQAIFTLRDSTEGGHIELNNQERKKVLEILIETQPDYIDLEMNSDEALLKQVVKLAVDNNIDIIFSSHDFEKTPSYEKAYEIIDSFIHTLNQNLNLDSKIVDNSIYKLIFTAQKFEDNLIPLKICKAFSQQNLKVICFCMGKTGIFSRISCVNAGSFLTYASFEDQTAPGQIHIRKLREVHEMVFSKHK
jgi:3-dehydroquinate dehydratase-1